MKTAAFITLGCKINQYETEAIREEVLALGYEEVPPDEPADVYIVNTCAVTAESAAKSRKYAQRSARLHPGARILVVGCSTPADKKLLASIPQVALVAGNEGKALVAGFLGGATGSEGTEGPRRSLLSLRVSRYAGRTRAVVKVQDGCDSFCSFCVIPFVRGRSKSRPASDVIEEVRRLAANGYREIVVSGVHVQHYGSDLEPQETLEDLLARIAGVPGLQRVRLSSMGVKAFTPQLFQVLENPLICPHWHVPLQSGSDAVLARMRRDYTAGEFREVVARLRERFPDPSFSTDAIAGFPGETPEQFEETLGLCREVGFSKIHVFPFSARDGTLAAKLGGFVKVAEVRRRARVLRDLERELALGYKERFVGRVVDVLVEGKALPATPADPRDPGGALPILEGFTERYVKVRFAAPSAEAARRFRGSLQPVKLTAAHPAFAEGEWAGEVKDSVDLNESGDAKGSLP